MVIGRDKGEPQLIKSVRFGFLMGGVVEIFKNLNFKITIAYWVCNSEVFVGRALF